MYQKIFRFNSIQELQESIDKQANELTTKIDIQSKLIGDKIRKDEKKKK